MRLLVKSSRQQEEGGYKPAEKYVGVGFFNTWNTLICGNCPKAQAAQMGFVGERVAFLKLRTMYAIVRFLLHFSILLQVLLHFCY